MAFTSSLDQEATSAMTSPERPHSAGSSSSVYHEAPEYPQDTLIESSPTDIPASARSRHLSPRIASSQTVPLQVIDTNTTYSPPKTHTTLPQTLLSGAARSFLPHAQTNRATSEDHVRFMQTIPEENENAPTTHSNKRTSSTVPTSSPSLSPQPTPANRATTKPSPPKAPYPTLTTQAANPLESRPPHLLNFFTSHPSNPPPSRPSNRPVYDNQTPGVPTHWIPIYGSGHSIFYDPITKLFHNDGSPRPTLERPDGSMPPLDTTDPLPRFNEHREDVLRLQPRAAITDTLIPKTQDTSTAAAAAGHRSHYYYCKCQHTWLTRRHGCPDGRAPSGLPWLAGVPLMGSTAAVRPGDTIPASEFTHVITVGDLGYLTPAQRYAYDNDRPMPAPAAPSGRTGSRGIRR